MQFRWSFNTFDDVHYRIFQGSQLKIFQMFVWRDVKPSLYCCYEEYGWKSQLRNGTWPLKSSLQNDVFMSPVYKNSTESKSLCSWFGLHSSHGIGEVCTVMLQRSVDSVEHFHIFMKWDLSVLYYYDDHTDINYSVSKFYHIWFGELI